MTDLRFELRKSVYLLGELERILTYLLEAEGRARPETGRSKALVAHCHFGLGKRYQRTGKRQQAQEHFTTATTMSREMDMGVWLEKAEAELSG